MKIWKLVSGIISIVLVGLIVFQSCAAGLYNAIADNGEASGSAGIIVAILLLAGGIVSIATRNSRGKGGNISLIVIFLLAAIIGFTMAGSYKDLIIWAAWCTICAILAIVSLIQSGKKRVSSAGSSTTVNFSPNTAAIQESSYNLGKKEARPSGNQRKPIIKRVWFWILVILASMILGGFIGSLTDSHSDRKDNKTSQDNKPAEESSIEKLEKETDTKGSDIRDTNKPDTKETELNLGETWEVDGEWKFTLTSAALTNDRNEFSEAQPEAVLYLKYEYENIGFEDEFGDGLTFLVDRLMDSEGNMCSTYPVNPEEILSQEAPIGGKSTGAEAFGLVKAGSPCKLYLEKYDSAGETNYKAIYNIEF